MNLNIVCNYVTGAIKQAFGSPSAGNEKLTDRVLFYAYHGAVGLQSLLRPRPGCCFPLISRSPPEALLYLRFQVTSAAVRVYLLITYEKGAAEPSTKHP